MNKDARDLHLIEKATWCQFPQLLELSSLSTIIVKRRNHERERERERDGCGFNKPMNSSSKLCCLPWEESTLKRINEPLQQLHIGKKILRNESIGMSLHWFGS